MLRVRDIMTRHVVTLAADRSIESAAWRFATDGVSGAPVRDRAGNIVGMLSKTDLVDPVIHGELAKTIDEAMTPAVWAVGPDARAMEAVQLMIDKDIHRVLVLGGPGKIEGIVSTMDVMRAVARGAEFGPPATRIRSAEGEER